jgi:hypothetical protein
MNSRNSAEQYSSILNKHGLPWGFLSSLLPRVTGRKKSKFDGVRKGKEGKVCAGV